MKEKRPTRTAPILALAIALATQTQAVEPLPTEDSIRALLDGGEWFRATREIDRLVDARLAAGAAFRPDPVLDRLIGEVFAPFSPAIARILLERAAVDPSTVDRTRY